MNYNSFRNIHINFIFRLKEGVTFHLFITTAPCGDARIFSLHESSSSTNLEAKNKTENEEQKPEDQTANPEMNDNNNGELPTVNGDKNGEISTVSDPNNNNSNPGEPEVLENFGNDTVAIYVTKAEDVEKKCRGPRPPSDSSK